MKKTTIILFVLVFIISSIGLAGCSSSNTASSGKVIQVGTDAAYPPFEKQEGGKIVGFDVDIFNAVAEEAGIKINIQHTGWDPLFEDIDKGTVDAGISAITITEDRKKLYDFSDPYFEATQLIMVSKDSNVTKLKDLDGKKIGVQSATTGDLAVQAVFGKTYSGLKGYDDTPAAVDDLLLGRLDAVVADNAVLQEYIKVIKNDNFKLVKDPSFEVEHYGIMVKKGNSDLLAKINEGLKKIKENGTYDKIFNKYFGK